MDLTADADAAVVPLPATAPFCSSAEPKIAVAITNAAKPPTINFRAPNRFRGAPHCEHALALTESCFWQTLHAVHKVLDFKLSPKCLRLVVQWRQYHFCCFGIIGSYVYLKSPIEKLGLFLSKSLNSSEHEQLIRMITRKRHAAGYTQEFVSNAIGQHQSYMAKLETGQRRLDVVEYIAIAKVIGFDPAAELHVLAAQFDLKLFRG